MQRSEGDTWTVSICAWFAFVYFGYFAIGGVLFHDSLGSPHWLQKLQFTTLEQLQETPCLGCQLFEFQQTSKGIQYCCRIKGIDILEHPSQSNLKSHCLDKGTSDFNEYTQAVQFNQNRQSKIKMFWFIFKILNIIGIIVLPGIMGIRHLYLKLFSSPRPIQRIGFFLSDIFHRDKASKNKKTKVYALNEQMQHKTQSENELQIVGQVKEEN